MRVIVTPLFDQGRLRVTRAGPIDAHLRSHRDDAGRLVYQLYDLDKGGKDALFGRHLINPQAGPVERKAIYYGFQRTDSGALVAQAWEVEPVSRR